jgi:hypothetical protein
MNANSAEHMQPKGGSESASSQPEILHGDSREADILADPEIFAGRGIKITNLQATMTSNEYVAGRLPLAASRAIEDLMMFSPDYLSVKTLTPLPKRRPVGVGLVTTPKPLVKESDKKPEPPGIQPTRP